jgi:hypothetical protein
LILTLQKLLNAGNAFDGMLIRKVKIQVPRKHMSVLRMGAPSNYVKAEKVYTYPAPSKTLKQSGTVILTLTVIMQKSATGFVLTTT